MTIHAYHDVYLNNVQTSIGDCFDYAINVLDLNADNFINQFASSNISECISRGDITYVSGKSGVDILLEVIYEFDGTTPDISIVPRYNRSKEYWIGWAVAYYQWYSDIDFSMIFKAVSYKKLSVLYKTYHEADITKFVDFMHAQMKLYLKDTNLKRIRKNYGLSQSELAAKSGVSLRSIQMYEQRKKKINKASLETVYALAKVLKCDVIDLMEKIDYHEQS